MGHARDAREELGPFVLFSEVAGRFVAGALYMSLLLNVSPTELVASFQDSQLADLAYDEIFFMFMYISIYPTLYYKEYGNARRLENPTTLPSDWLCDFLYDLAERLYPEAEARHFHAVAMSFFAPDLAPESVVDLIWGPETPLPPIVVSRGGISRLRVAVDLHAYGVSRETDWFQYTLEFDWDELDEEGMDDHDGAVCDMARRLGQFVLFSNAAGRFAVLALARWIAFRITPTEMSDMFEIEHIDHLAYDEIYCMQFYASRYTTLYYEDDGDARRIEGPENLPENWLEYFLFDIADRLYLVRKEQHETRLVNSFMNWPSDI